MKPDQTLRLSVKAGWASPQAGFTLMEVLIALAISSTLILLLMNALVVQSRTQVRLANLNEAQLSQQVSAAQLGRFLSGLVVPVARRGESCRGDAQTFSCPTARTGAVPQIQMVQLSFEIDAGGVRLRSVGDGQDQGEIAFWSDMVAAEFSYLHRDGSWRSEFDPLVTWPEELGIGDMSVVRPAVTPKGLAIRLTDASGTERWIALPARDVWQPVTIGITPG